jgi:acyl-coenzyme A synthetase/AMP-(fatty) acid ligase
MADRCVRSLCELWSHVADPERHRIIELSVQGEGFAEAIAEIRNRGFRTGDMGLPDENGVVQLMGRMDDILKVCGHKINPREVESVLQRHTSVAEAVVIELVDQRKNMEAIHAFVVPRKNARPVESELVDHCRQHLELYKVPARIYFRELSLEDRARKDSAASGRSAGH